MQASAKPRKRRAHAYRKVLDFRKRRVRGLWQRNGKFYANLTVADELGRKCPRWVALAGATLDEAKSDYARLLTERDDDRLRPVTLTPKLADYVGSTDLKAPAQPSDDSSAEPADPNDGTVADQEPAEKGEKLATFSDSLRVSGKRETSIKKELGYLRRWVAELGHLRLNKIRPHHLNHVLTKLAREGCAGRSVNLYLIAIRSVLKAAMRDGHIKPPLPFEGLAWQRVDQKSRELYTPAEIDVFCEIGLVVSKNGRQFTDYLRFLQYSGARRSEALRVRWRDVDFKRAQVTIGAEGDAKNREARHVDFNPALEAHLKDMRSRRQPDCDWLFPSPQRGERDLASKTFMESLRLTRDAAGYVRKDCERRMPGTDLRQCVHCKSERIARQEKLLSAKLQKFGFHDLRHHFISYAVMSGVDFMTIARWVGHKDGGILIGKVYGHLADEHRKAQAARLTFGPVVATKPVAIA
jgi:integrase